jgi:hypothetical protein
LRKQTGGSFVPEAKFREQFAAPAAPVISRRQNTFGNRVLTMISVWLGA